MKENNPDKSSESQQRLEAIKNLIFGENIEQIDKEFESIKKHVESRREELNSLIEETHKELNTLIDNVSTEINIRITDLEEKMYEKTEQLDQNKVDKNTLGNLLVSLGQKIMKD